MRSTIRVAALLLLIAGPLQAQIKEVWEPGLQYAHRLSDLWSLNAGAVAFATPEVVERTEASLFLNRRLPQGWTLSGGYLMRVGTPFESTAGIIEHRFTAQVGYVQAFERSRLAHRMRLDRRDRITRTQIRARYRLGWEKPLRGDRIDAGEPYLLLQQEVLGTWSEAPATGETRSSAVWGWQLQGGRKFETGLQFRFEDLGGAAGVDQVLLLTTVFSWSR